ncbi:DNA replication/repair protein RecF [Cyanobium sp. Morenito 9A2]|uniref:DNA replication/repair protein RecF n=1 Tax=Cyanobium sp. Morenito 9A2 TaxID=2823718 RepID=UPI0020CF60EB|nr:DNA replication/repair protein RecF [Cyanobium sp. Morenito 9A2]MCP9850603.1 DNA replication/repair protein RecF [Cyanobium sp. Morenito 9A2]
MRLHRLELLQFRNYAALSLELSSPRLLVIGDNGEGKSNLLEAVELLGSLRSHRTSRDQDLIGQGESLSRLGGWSPDGDHLELELRRVGGRQVRRNGKTLERHLDLLGPLRCVGFSALDLELVRGEPSLRRQWLDRVVLQLEPIYSELLSRYGRLLRQRSQLLRRGLGRAHLADLLGAFDQQMSLVGTRLHRRRRRALVRLQPLAAAWQERLSGGREQLELRYQPGSVLEGEEAEAPWREAIEAQLLAQRQEELRSGHCGVGPHRDEVELRLADQPARRYGSAGQQRTLVLALKLAELELVQQLWGAPPLLLLDDVLAELDLGRQHLLLEAVGEGHQCLVSATHLGAFSGGWRSRSQLVRVSGGAIKVELAPP